MNDVLILIIGAVLAIFIGSWLGTRELNKSSNKLKNAINESFKKFGTKALSIFAIFNLFDSSNSELQQDDEPKQD